MLLPGGLGVLLASVVAGQPVGEAPLLCESGDPKNNTKINCKFQQGKPVDIVAHGDLDEGCKILHITEERTCCYMDRVRNFREDPELCDRLQQPSGCWGEADFLIEEKKLNQVLGHGTCTLHIPRLRSQDMGMYKAVFVNDQNTNKSINIEEVKSSTLLIVLPVALGIIFILAAILFKYKNEIMNECKEKIVETPTLGGKDGIQNNEEGTPLLNGQEMNVLSQAEEAEEEAIERNKLADKERIRIDNFGVQKADNLLNDLFQNLLIIGKTGTGKSSLCNKISGLKSNSQAFPVSPAAESCTQSTVLANIKFGGKRERLVSLIDTMGFDDPNSDNDARIITELVNTLKNNCKSINLFGIAVNGHAPRLDGSLVHMIRIFEQMFGDAFWKQCVIIFTRVPMGTIDQNRRIERNDQTDDDIARDYLKVVEEKFPNATGGLRFLYLDACYYEDDESAVKYFDTAMEELFLMIKKAPKLPTFEVRENVSTENAKLHMLLEESERKRKEDRQEQKVVNQKLENEVDKLKKEIQSIKEATEQKTKDMLNKEKDIEKELEGANEEDKERLKGELEQCKEERKMMEQKILEDLVQQTKALEAAEESAAKARKNMEIELENEKKRSESAREYEMRKLMKKITSMESENSKIKGDNKENEKQVRDLKRQIEEEREEHSKSKRDQKKLNGSSMSYYEAKDASSTAHSWLDKQIKDLGLQICDGVIIENRSRYTLQYLTSEKFSGYPIGDISQSFKEENGEFILPPGMVGVQLWTNSAAGKVLKNLSSTAALGMPELMLASHHIRGYFSVKIKTQNQDYVVSCGFMTGRNLTPNKMEIQIRKHEGDGDDGKMTHDENSTTKVHFEDSNVIDGYFHKRREDGEIKVTGKLKRISNNKHIFTFE